MANRSSQEVINGCTVVRYNGNNCSGGRAPGGEGRCPGLKKAPRWVQEKAARSAAQRRIREADYARRYLGGETDGLGRHIDR